MKLNDTVKKQVTIVDEVPSPFRVNNKEKRNNVFSQIHVQIPYQKKNKADESILSDEEDPYSCTPRKEKPSNLSILREESIKIMRQNDNLDLDKYKKYIGEFYKFSGDLFEFDSNIFQSKKKDPSEVLESKMRRSLENEYNLTTKELSRKGKNPNSISPERVRKILNQLPPFPADVINPDDIDSFQKKGTIGWNYLTQQLLNGSSILDEKLEALRLEKEEKLRRKQRAQSQATIKSVQSTIEDPKRGDDSPAKHNTRNSDFIGSATFQERPKAYSLHQDPSSLKKSVGKKVEPPSISNTNISHKSLLSKNKIIKPNLVVKNNLINKTVKQYEGLSKSPSKELSLNKPQTAKVLKRLNKTSQPIRMGRNAPPFIVLESGDLGQRYPQIEMKMLILRILNQKVVKMTDITDQTSILYNLIERDLGKGKGQTQTFTFMIDETDSEKKPRPQPEVKSTVYQEIKQKNFQANDKNSKKIHIRIVDEISQDQKTDSRIYKQCEQTLHTYKYTEVEFEPIKLSDLVGGSSHEEIAFKIFGRIDLSLFPSKNQNQSFTAKESYDQTEKETQMQTSTPMYSSGPIHVNRKADQRAFNQTQYSSHSNQANLNIYNNITSLNKNVIVPKGFPGSRMSFDQRLNSSYDEALPEISHLQNVYGAPQSRGRLSNSSSIQKERLMLQNNYYKQQLKNAQIQKGATSQGIRSKNMSALDDMYGRNAYLDTTGKRRVSNQGNEEETHYQDVINESMISNEPPVHANTTYGTLVNVNRVPLKPNTSMPFNKRNKNISYKQQQAELQKAETVKKMPLRKLVNSVYRQQKRISYESYLQNRPVQTNYYTTGR